jgi:sarcosine oxidase subunit delta
MLLACPYCGSRPIAEFAFGCAEEAATRIDEPAAIQLQRIYLRTNPRGLSKELWQHVSGCRAWLLVERDTVTHVVSQTRPAVAGSGE